MKFFEFKNLIEETLKKAFGNNEEQYPLNVKAFMSQMKNISEELSSNAITSLTILFEGFYQSITDPTFSAMLIDIRSKRWNSHYSMPTISFLLTYDKAIKETKAWFSNDMNQTTKPWLIQLNAETIITDENNDVAYDSVQLVSAFEEIDVPPEEEKAGVLVKTHNPTGGFTTAPTDPFSQEFLEYADIICARGGRVLEIGTGFGAAALRIHGKGGQVFANDIEPRNLAVVLKRFAKTHGIVISASSVLTGDAGDINTSGELVNIPGALPNELAAIPDESIDAILISRVLHFFRGAVIEDCFKLFAKKLKPGGMLFLTCETPFLKNWTNFIPEYEARKARDVRWPGEIEEPAKYESRGYAAALPSFMHFMGVEELNRALIAAGFEIKNTEYINRAGQFAPDLLLDGRESVGACVKRPGLSM